MRFRFYKDVFKQVAMTLHMITWRNDLTTAPSTADRHLPRRTVRGPSISRSRDCQAPI